MNKDHAIILGYSICLRVFFFVVVVAKPHSSHSMHVDSRELRATLCCCFIYLLFVMRPIGELEQGECAYAYTSANLQSQATVGRFAGRPIMASVFCLLDLWSPISKVTCHFSIQN